MNRERLSLEPGSLDAQNLFAALRILLLFATLYAFAAYGSTSFHDVDPRDVAQNLDELPVIGWLPGPLLIFLGAALNPYGLRYIITPLAALFFILVAGAFYVKDVYALPDLGSAFRYITASMFTLRYPRLVVDKGARQVKGSEINLIEKVGGPGFVSIEPGSAAIFRFLREPGPSLFSTTHYMAPFETIAQTVDLDEQQEKKEEIKAITRDGIKVVLRDVHIRYRIKQQIYEGVPVRRSLKDPWPLDPDSLRNMLLNLSVNSGGLQKWQDAVEGAVVGQITDYIASHSIDQLTAPRNGFINPRIEMLSTVTEKVKKPLGDLGAELLWIDVGHLDIAYDLVDEQRTSLWAADWVGDSTVSRSYTEAIRQAYQELGRAQAQAEIILSISDALSNANLPNNTDDNLRRLLLVRTSQVLDSLSTKPMRPE